MQSWLCPSDRQLRLRACIARGWSTPRSAVASLTSAECAAISNVLRRDRALRLLDWGRVSRAADQVERLRLAQCGDGDTACRLCGRQLRYRWWRPSGHCADCGFRFCDTCAKPLPPDAGDSPEAKQPACSRFCSQRPKEAATWLCKLCKESRLLTAKSGAWFHDRLGDSLASDFDEIAESRPGGQPDSVNQDSPLDSQQVTSQSNSLSRSFGSTNQSQAKQPAKQGGETRSKAFRSHLDLPSHHGQMDGQSGGTFQRHPASGLVSHNGQLHRARHLAIIRRAKSASCSQIGQAQCEYFPTELVDG